MAGSKGSKYFDIFLNYNFWLTGKDGSEILGKDFLLLLENIGKEGSIQAAAKKNKISYRKAWGDIKKTEESLKFALIETKRGGKDGGKSFLTKDAENMLEAFKELEAEFDKVVHDTARTFFHKLNKDKKNDTV